jgi:isopentenyldiphosphate isomerase/intracellular septation protein A
MNKVDLLKKLLPGFIPLFVFIIADEIWGTKVGLIVAVSFGLGQLVFTYLREKRIDRFTLLDTALIVLLGGISMVFDNDLFFKLKPGLMESVLCVILAVSIFTPANILFAMSKRYMGEIDMNDQLQKQMKRSMLAMFFLFTTHTVLVFYSAIYMSKESWVFISGGLFYILFGVYMLYEFLRIKFKSIKQNSVEWVPLVDEQGKVIGKATRAAVHANKNLLHPVVHLHILNNKSEIYLQKRPLNKDIQPGKWDTAVGGHVMLGETIEQALKREVKEEVNISLNRADILVQYIWKTEIESELVFSFVLQHNETIIPNKNEVDECKFWTLNDIMKNLGKGMFTPNFEHEFSILKKALPH